MSAGEMEAAAVGAKRFNTVGAIENIVEASAHDYVFVKSVGWDEGWVGFDSE